MAGLPDGRNSVFTEPSLAGERAARRLINTVSYESAEFLRLRDIALTNPQNQRFLRQANESRLNIEQAVNSLTILTDIPQNMIQRVKDALKTGHEILSNFDPVSIPAPTVSRLMIPSGEADSSRPQPTRVVSSGVVNLDGTFQGNRPTNVLTTVEEGIVRPAGTSETTLSGRVSELHPRTEIAQTAPARTPVDDSQSIGAIYSEGLNRTTSNQPHAVAHEVSLTPSELTLVSGVNQTNRRPQLQRSTVDRSISVHNAQSAGQAPRNTVMLGQVATTRTGTSSSMGMLLTNTSNNVITGRVAAPRSDAAAHHAPTGDAVTRANGQGLRTLNSAQVTYNAPLEKDKIIRRYEQLRQNLSSRMNQELAQVAEIAEEQQATAPMIHSVSFQHGSRPPDPLTMHTQHTPSEIQQMPLNAHAQSFNPVTVPTPVHPHDFAQDQLHAQLHAHPSTQTTPQFQGSTPFVTVNPQSQMGQVAASQPIATTSRHSANPYATVFSRQNSHTHQSPLGRNPNQPGDVDIATSLLTVNLRQHSRDLMIAGRPPKNAKFSGKSTQDFESHMATFDRVTNLEGITDEMRCLELRHWLEGSPLIILTQYDKIKEGDIAYQKIRNHLEKVYGRKVFTAREMLDDLLQGSRLKDPIAIEEFILQMEKTYVDAVATHRDATFSTNDTFNAILRCKLPHFYADKWAAKKTVADDKYMEDKSKPYSLTFPFFISYCRQMNDTTKNKKAIHRDESKTTSSNPSTSSQGGAGKGNASKETAKTVNLAATDAVSVAATSHQKKGDGKFKKYPKNAQQKQQTGTSSTAQPARAPTPLPPEKKQVPGGLYCYACKASTHSTLKCREFGKMSFTDKKALVFKVKACFKCLEPGHMSNACPKTTKCETCASTKHNTHFHGYEK